MDDYITENVTGTADLQTFTAGDTTFQYVIEEAGDPDLRPMLRDTVIADYTGKLTNEDTFDSRTAEFPLSGVIRGWQLGVQLIGVGGKITLFLPPNLAYGNRQVGQICPNSPLIFDIELLEVRRE